MSLRRKTMLTTGLALLGLLAAVFALTETTLLGSYARLEESRTLSELDRGVSVIQGEVNDLTVLIEDWAEWDDTYAFMADRGEGYIKSNLLDAGLIAVRLNVMVFVDCAGNVVFGKAVDLRTAVQVPLPSRLAGPFVPDDPLFVRGDGHGTQGIVMLAEGPMLVVSRPIKTSTGQGPSHGTILFGRWLNEAAVARLSEKSRLALSICPIRDLERCLDFTEGLRLGDLGQPRVHVSSADRITAFARLPDVSGNPALVLRLSASRDVYRQGLRTARMLVLFLVLSGLAFVGSSLLIVERTVLRRLSRLNHDVAVIGQKQDLAARVTVVGKDELGQLGGAINRLLASVEITRAESVKRQRYLRTLVAVQQRLLTEGHDADSPYDRVLPLLGEAAGASRVYVFRNHRGPANDLRMSQVAEWCAPGVSRQIDNAALQDLPYAPQFTRWQDTLASGEPIEGPVATFPAVERGILESQGILALLVLPLMAGGEFFGFIGFDNCRVAAPWDSADVQLLQVGAGALSGAIERQQAEEELQIHRHSLEELVQERTQRLVEAERQILQGEKLASVGRLATGVAHEINTPIQYVGDNLHALSDSFADLRAIIDQYQELVGMVAQGTARPDSAAKVRAVEQAHDLAYLLDDAPKAIAQGLEGVERVGAIVRAMKDFSHLRGEAATSVNLNECLSRTLTVARNEYKYVADVVTDFADLPLVECYPGELNQVFLNLVVNAAHAIQDTGRHGTIRLRTRLDGDRVEISVSDTGVGIHPDVRGKIYEPFFTTKPIGRGTGLGLCIAHQVVTRKHNGEISFETEVGVGTTFFVRLPLRRPATEGNEPEGDA